MRTSFNKYGVLAAALFCALQLFLTASAGAATAIAVAAPPGAANQAPTITLLYAVENPQATLVTVLGGEGRIGINESSTGTRNQTTQMTQLLTRSGFTGVRVNVVVFDSPIELYPSTQRLDADHQDRIAAVVRYYQTKFAVPVWLFGHSNGTTSVSEYLRRKQAETPVSGAVLSGSNNAIRLPDELNIPLLFLHNENDECRNTQPNSAKSHFEDARRINKAATEIMLVKGGESKGDPCRDGRHMYYGAQEEAARNMATFLEKNVK